ncbi:MAG: hypothetical protein FWB90_00985 [Fibromonadales bacterium]|nr:hypothetical protein [Fibromonadales bacterium]
MKLGHNERQRREAITRLVSKARDSVKIRFLKNKRRIVGLCVLLALCVAAFIFVIPSVQSDDFMSFKKITPVNLKRISPDAFRKIIGFNYREEIYSKDTAYIRARLEASNMIFGDVQFIVNFIPYELEIKFTEASPLFVVMSAEPVIYSDKGEIYPYSANIADLPVVKANEPGDIALAIKFLIDMRKNDAMLYSRVSQLIPSEADRQIMVFFNDVDFKTKFSLEDDCWKIAYRHYRQLTRNMQVLNIHSIAVLDLRFRQLAYITEKNGRL